MNVKNEPHENFFRISHKTFESGVFKELKPGTKILYMTLCHLRNRFGNKDGVFFRTDRDLVDDSGLAPATIAASKKELIQAGFLRWKKGGPRRACRYQIWDKK